MAESSEPLVDEAASLLSPSHRHKAIFVLGEHGQMPGLEAAIRQAAQPDLDSPLDALSKLTVVPRRQLAALVYQLTRSAATLPSREIHSGVEVATLT